MTKLTELRAELQLAKDHFERLSHVGGDEFFEAGRDLHAVHDVYMAEVYRELGTPPAPLATYNGMPPLSGPHEHTHKQFPPIVSCHEFEDERENYVDEVMWYLRGFACAIATVVITVIVVAALLYATGA
tara:strand:+ start:4881 stop:5267 length:387 start_codon:yes stop_codon:yes gene_type:complete